jgi:hypothetical protein
VQYDPFYGDPRITVFDPPTNQFNQLHSMAHGRWYATAITLGDGRVLAFSRYDETGAVKVNALCQAFAQTKPFSRFALEVRYSFTPSSTVSGILF